MAKLIFISKYITLSKEGFINGLFKSLRIDMKLHKIYSKGIYRIHHQIWYIIFNLV